MAKVEILSLGIDGDNAQSGILTGVIPEGSMVRTGDVVATILLSPKIQTIKGDDDEEQPEENKEIPIHAPQTGRVTEVSHQLQESVKIGDCLLHIDDSDFHADMKALEENLQILSAVPPKQQPRLPNDYMDTLLGLEDAFRLQTIIQRIPNVFQAQSLQLNERLLELQKENPTDLANTHTQIGVIMYNLGDLERTLKHLHKALQLREEALGSDNPQVAATCIHLGALYRNSGDFENSLKYMLQAVDIQKKSLGEDHPVVASTYNNIGALYYQSNDFAKAIQEYEKALTIHTRTSGEEHIDTAGTYHNLGVAWKHLRDHKTAKTYLQKALLIRQLHHDTTNSSTTTADVAVSHTALGQLHAESAHYEEALEEYHAALALQIQFGGPNSPMTVTTHNHIGAVHYETGAFRKALEAYRTGLDILCAAQEANPLDTAASWNHVGVTLLKIGEVDQALEHHQEALRILKGIYGPKHPNLAITIGSIGNVYKAQERWEQALIEYQVAHELLTMALGTTDHPDIASSYNNLGLVLSQLPGSEAEALEHYRAACTSFERTLGSDHPHCGSCRYNVALLLQSLGRKDEAKTEFEKARDIWTRHFGPDHSHVANAQKGVEECS